MRVRRTWPVALLAPLALAPVLAACDGSGFDPEAARSSATTESGDAAGSESASSEPTTDQSSPTEPTEPSDPSEGESSDDHSGPVGPIELPAACDAVSSADVAAAYHVKFGPGQPGSGATDERGLQWKSDNCGFVAPDLVEVKVKLSGTDDFPTGSFGCPQPTDIAAIVEPVDDVAGADEAWWKTSEAPPLRASFRACTDMLVLEIDLEYEDGVDYEGDPRNDSAALAEKVLAAISG